MARPPKSIHVHSSLELAAVTIPSSLRTRAVAPVDLPEARYKGFQPGSTVLRTGFRYQRGALPLPCDVVRDKTWR